MIQLKQIKKDMFSAYFQIIDTETREVPVKIQGKSETMTQYSKVIGGVWVEGKLGSMEAKVHIEMFGKNLDLRLYGYGYCNTHLDGKIYKVLRQYEILEDSGLIGKIPNNHKQCLISPDSLGIFHTKGSVHRLFNTGKLQPRKPEADMQRKTDGCHIPVSLL